MRVACTRSFGRKATPCVCFQSFHAFFRGEFCVCGGSRKNLNLEYIARSSHMSHKYFDSVLHMVCNIIMRCFSSTPFTLKYELILLIFGCFC
jgi:hypothetical protein